MSEQTPGIQQNNSVIDLKALAEPAVKLIETVGNAIGVIYEPRRMKNIAKAEIEVAKIKFAGQLELQELAERAEERNKNKELRRQQNIESITSQAIHLLPEALPEQKPEEDWIVDFYEKSQDVSNEQMQILWAKILAGEFAKPKSFSLRTLSFVKTLSQEEAETFAKCCNYFWKSDGPDLNDHFFTEETDKYLKSQGIDFIHFITLETLGLIKTGLVYTFGENEDTITSFYGNHCIKLQPGTPPFHGPLSIHRLTQTGIELARLVECTPDEKYLSILKESLIKSNIHMNEVK